MITTISSPVPSVAHITTNTALHQHYTKSRFHQKRGYTTWEIIPHYAFKSEDQNEWKIVRKFSANRLRNRVSRITRSVLLTSLAFGSVRRSSSYLAIPELYNEKIGSSTRERLPLGSWCAAYTCIPRILLLFIVIWLGFFSFSVIPRVRQRVALAIHPCRLIHVCGSYLGTQWPVFSANFSLSNEFWAIFSLASYCWQYRTRVSGVVIRSQWSQRWYVFSTQLSHVSKLMGTKKIHLRYNLTHIERHRISTNRHRANFHLGIDFNAGATISNRIPSDCFTHVGSFGSINFPSTGTRSQHGNVCVWYTYVDIHTKSKVDKLWYSAAWAESSAAVPRPPNYYVPNGDLSIWIWRGEIFTFDRIYSRI